MGCPNKTHPDWIEYVNKHGENAAWDYFLTTGDIPSTKPSEANDVLYNVEGSALQKGRDYIKPLIGKGKPFYTKKIGETLMLMARGETNIYKDILNIHLPKLKSFGLFTRILKISSENKDGYELRVMVDDKPFSSNYNAGNNLEETNAQEENSSKINSVLMPILKQMGITEMTLDEYKKIVYEKTGETVPDAVNAVADLSRMIMALKPGELEYTKLEEIMHLLLASKRNSQEYIKLTENIHLTKHYDDVKRNPVYEANYTEEEIRREATDRLIRDYLLETYKVEGAELVNIDEATYGRNAFRVTLKRVWDSFVGMFNKQQEMKNASKKILKELLNGEAVGYAEKVFFGEGVLYNADPNSKYTQFLEVYNKLYGKTDFLDKVSKMEEKVSSQIGTLIKKKIIYERKGLALGLKGIQETIDSSIKDHKHPEAEMQDKKLTNAALRVMLRMASDIDNSFKRMEKLKKTISVHNLNSYSDEVNKLVKYIHGYSDFLNDVGNTLRSLESEGTITAEQKELLTFVNHFQASADQIKKDLHSVMLDRLSEFLYEKVLYRMPYFKSAEQVRERLVASRDMSRIEGLFESFKKVDDPILQALSMVLQDANEQSLVDRDYYESRILAVWKEARNNGVNMEDILDKNEFGPTGYFIGEYDYAAIREDKKEFFDSLNKRYGLIDKNGKFDRLKLEELDKDSKAKYRKEVGEYFERSTVERLDLQNYLDKKKEYFIKKYAEEKLKDTDPDLYESQKKQALAIYDEWYNNNARLVERRDGTSYWAYSKELTVPRKDYKRGKFVNRSYEKMAASSSKQDQATLKFLKEMREIKKDLDMLIGREITNNDRIPAYRKDMMEIIKNSKSFEELGKNIKGELGNAVLQKDTDMFTQREDFMNNLSSQEMDYYNKLTDLEENPISFLPTHGAAPIKNPGKNLSTDVVSNMLMYAGVATKYDTYSNIMHIMEVAKDLLYDRDIVLGRDIVSRTKKVGDHMQPYLKNLIAKSKKKGGTAAEMFDQFLSMHMYGERYDDSSKTSRFLSKLVGMPVSSAKVGNLAMQFVALKYLSFNLYSMINNPLIGNLTLWEEIAAREGKVKASIELNKANAVYASEITKGYLTDFKNPYAENKLVLVERMFGYTGKSDRLSGGREVGRTGVGKYITSDVLFLNIGAGEHQMQSMNAIYHLKKQEVTLKDGTKSNLWDSLEVVDGTLKLKDNVQDKITPKDMKRIGYKISAFFRRSNQGVRELDIPVGERQFLIRAVNTFRRFIPPVLERRFLGWGRMFDSTLESRYDFELDEVAEGMYVTVIASILRARQLKNAYNANLAAGDTKMSWKEAWKESKKDLTESQLRNFKLVQNDLVTLLFITILSGMLRALGEDDDEKTWSYNMATYQLARLTADKTFAYNFESFLKIINSPAAGISLLEDLMKMFNTVSPIGWTFSHTFGEGKIDFFDRYKIGDKKGELKLWKHLRDFTPVYNQVHDAFYPEEKNKYFN